MNLVKYIGRPYETYNCFDLVKEFYKDHFNVELKNYFEGEIPTPQKVEVLIISNKGDFIKVDSPEFGDLVVLKIYGLECHLGVVVSPTMFLQSTKKTGSNMDRLSRWQNMIAGFYRLKGMAL